MFPLKLSAHRRSLHTYDSNAGYDLPLGLATFETYRYFILPHPTCHSFSRVHIQFSSFAPRTSPSHEVNHYYIYFMYKSSNVSIFLLSTPLDRPFSVSRLYRYTLISLFHIFTLSSSRLPTSLDTFFLPFATRTWLDPHALYFTSIPIAR